MMYNKLLLGSALSATLLLSGCGGGGDTAVSTLPSTGYLVDAAVANANYDCLADNDYNKTTGSDGSFTCQHMNQIRFRIGNLVLGEIAALPQDGYVLPQDLAGTDRSDIYNDKVTAIAQLLQSLDSDGNLVNGIQIPDEAKDVLDEESFNPSKLETYLAEASAPNTQIRTRTQAEQHLRDTMQSLNLSIDNSTFDINSFPMYDLTQELNETIAYMGNEERLAYDVYTYLYNYHMDNGVEIKQLTNIANNAESRHIEIVQSIVHKYNLDATTVIDNPVADSSVTLDTMPSGEYGIPAIQTLYDTLTAKGVLSKQDALEAGCMVEVSDVNDLNEDIQLAVDAGAEDVLAAYNILRDGSYNHYWAFDRGLKNMGVTDGCCSLGSEWCHPEYPQNQNGQGRR